jgi:hypothetical protein
VCVFVCVCVCVWRFSEVNTYINLNYIYLLCYLTKYLVALIRPDRIVNWELRGEIRSWRTIIYIYVPLRTWDVLYGPVCEPKTTRMRSSNVI